MESIRPAALMAAHGAIIFKALDAVFAGLPNITETAVAMYSLFAALGLGAAYLFFVFVGISPAGRRVAHWCAHASEFLLAIPIGMFLFNLFDVDVGRLLSSSVEEGQLRPNTPIQTLSNATPQKSEEASFMSSSDVLLVSFTGVLTAATIWLALATRGLWKATLTAIEHARADSARQGSEFAAQLAVADSSSVAARDSANALVLAQRPWIAVELSLLRVSRSKDTMEWLFSPVCTNVGRAPAINVRVGVGIAPYPVGTPWDFARAIAEADNHVAEHHHKGFALFPSEDNESEGANHKEALSQADIEAAAGDGRRYAVMVCVFVHYDFAGGKGITRRIYILGSRDDGYFDVGAVEVDAEKVKITRIPLSELAV